MSMWRMAKAGRGVAVVLLAAGLTVSAAGCGGGGGDDGDKKSGSSESSKGGGTAGGQEGDKAGGQDEEPVAEIKSKGGVELRVFELKRDSGGFVTVNGQMKNTSSKPFTDTANWGGIEEGMGGNSLAGASLVDKSGKKRYYVLRDTEKRCLCTSGIVTLDAGEELDVYIQFPAPPTKTKEIEFQLPTFPPTAIPISD
ncbi:hypothetical protein [Streptomyces boninensis]|uniref:hypothetical protein n=1 Tax=Streptomyces boninensis TaxID=2039455 RepID=UPI003B224574